jgi:UDP-GlcNAc:undecaprenyl-phosphate GlcNAc-1-phosphate transferase
MNSIILLALCSFVLSLSLTPLLRNLALRHGLLDTPDADRKLHKRAVPRVGGVPIMLAYAIAAGSLALTPFAGGRVIAGALPFALRLMPGLMVVFLTGLADDMFGLKPWHKLLGEVAASGCVCWAGFHIASIAGYHLNEWLAVPLTVVWLVVCTNAMNLIDGLDGLATGIGLFATLTMLIAALLQGNYAFALATAPLAGALCGFLCYNFNPASIFLGDSGSLSIGFLLGCFGIIWAQKSATLLGMTAPLIALAVPLLDTTLAITRRFLLCQPVFGGDRGHIHHRLLARGFTPRRVTYVLYVSAGIVAGISLILSSSGRFGSIALVAFCGIVWLAVRYLGYEEFDTAQRMILGVLFGGLFRRVLIGNLSISRMEAAVQVANTQEECWSALVEASRSFGFSQVSLQFNDGYSSARLAEVDSRACWNLHIPLNHSGHVDLRAPMNCSLAPATIGWLVTSVGTVFVDKLAAVAVHSSISSADSATHRKLKLLGISAATNIL